MEEAKIPETEAKKTMSGNPTQARPWSGGKEIGRCYNCGKSEKIITFRGLVGGGSLQAWLCRECDTVEIRNTLRVEPGPTPTPASSRGSNPDEDLVKAHAWNWKWCDQRGRWETHQPRTKANPKTRWTPTGPSKRTQRRRAARRARRRKRSDRPRR